MALSNKYLDNYILINLYYNKRRACVELAKKLVKFCQLLFNSSDVLIDTVVSLNWLTSLCNITLKTF